MVMIVFLRPQRFFKKRSRRRTSRNLLSTNGVTAHFLVVFFFPTLLLFCGVSPVASRWETRHIHTDFRDESNGGKGLDT